MKTEVRFTRKNHVISNVKGEVVFTGTFNVGKAKHSSINAAKRESRRLQAIHGHGSVRKVK